MPSLASVTFDTSGFHFQREHDDTRAWNTPAGDALDILYSPLKPDIDADVRSLSKIRQAIGSRVTAAGAAMIELETTTIDGCLALRQVIKARQQPQGTAYVGALILPFRDFSFVIKVQCREEGMTGLRDSIILAEALGDGRVMFYPEREEFPEGWAHDPYDPALRGFLRNLSEAPEYDARFPDHPLSRVRAILSHLESTLRVTKEVQESPPYVFAG